MPLISVAEAVFGTVLCRPEIACLDVGRLAFWLKLAQQQVALGALPADPTACWTICCGVMAEPFDEAPDEWWTGWLDAYFPVSESDGYRRSEAIATSSQRSLLQAAKRIQRARLGGLAKHKRVSASSNGGVGGVVLELQLPTSQNGAESSTSVPTEKAAVPLPQSPEQMGKRNWVVEAAEMWRAARGKPSYGRIGAALKEAVQEVGADDALVGWERYVKSDDAKFGEEHFARHWRKHVPRRLTPSLSEQDATVEAQAAREQERAAKWHTINGALIGGDLPKDWWDVISEAARSLKMDPVDVGYSDLQTRGMT